MGVRSAIAVCLALACLPLGARACAAAAPAPRLRLEVSHEAILDVLEVEGESWCGTSGGIQIFRGEQLVRALTADDGLPLGGVRDLEPYQGQVLAATGKGLYLIPHGAEGKARSMGPTTQVRCVAADSAGTLWIGTPQSLISLSSQGEVTGSWSSPVGPAARLQRYGSELFAAGTRGLARFTAGKWVAEALPTTAGEPWLTGTFEFGGRLYACGLEGLWVRVGEAWERAVISPSQTDVRDGTSFRGELWLATGEGVWSSVGGTVFRKQATLPRIRTLHASPAGDRMLAGTEERGLWRHGGSAWKKLTPPGPPPGEVTACAWEGERLWLAAFRGRLAARDASGWREVVSPAAAGEGITHLAVVGREVWCRTSDGRLWQRRNEKWEPRTHPLAWCSTLNAAEGTLCIGGLGQAWVREGDQWMRLTPTGIGKATVTSFLRHRGEWWVGTQHGLFRQQGKSGWKHHTLGTGLRDDWVTSLTAHGDRVWVGTFGGGIVVVSGAGQRWTNLPMDTNRIAALASGSGTWFGSPDGLFHVAAGGYPPSGAVKVAGWNVFALAASGLRLAVGTDAGIGISHRESLAGQARAGE